MLNSNRSTSKMLYLSIALLLFISSFTFQTNVFADLTDQTAEQYRGLGYEEQQKGNFNEALGYYSKAVSLGANSAVLFNDMGVLYEEIDMSAKARQYYLKAITADKKYLPPYNNIAYLYQRLGRKKEAAEFFKKRFELGDPNDPWTQKAKEGLVGLDSSYLPWAQSLEAKTLQKELVAKHHNDFYLKVQRSQEYMTRGEQYFEKGEYKKALTEFDSALRITPKNPKIKTVRNKTKIAIAKETIEKQTEYAIQRLESGDAVAARHEIQKILATIPNEPLLISP